MATPSAQERQAVLELVQRSIDEWSVLGSSLTILNARLEDLRAAHLGIDDPFMRRVQHFIDAFRLGQEDLAIGKAAEALHPDLREAQEVGLL
jgi:hypothetical protein